MNSLIINKVAVDTLDICRESACNYSIAKLYEKTEEMDGILKFFLFFLLKINFELY